MNEFTREELEQIAATDHVQCGDASALARMLLTAMDSEPVAWTSQRALETKNKIVAFTDDMSALDYGVANGWFDIVELYRHAQPAPVVPDKMTYQDGVLFVLNNDMSSIERGTVAMRAWNACLAAMLQGSQPVSNRDELPEEKGASLQLRNLIRQRHAEWSDKTFGNVGPVGPLKHLSKEALEAVAEPDDLSEWADMQFLLWDAQRRAGISDGEITAAMEEKLKVNMARQWPEPKDGEPRLHIKEQSESVLPEIECDICGHVSTDPEGRHHCCEDNSND